MGSGDKFGRDIPIPAPISRDRRMGSEDGWDRDAGDSGVTVTMGWQGQEWWEHLDGGDRDGRNRELWGQGDGRGRGGRDRDSGNKFGRDRRTGSGYSRDRAGSDRDQGDSSEGDSADGDSCDGDILGTVPAHRSRLGAHTMARFRACMLVRALCPAMRSRCRIRNSRVLRGHPGDT